MQGNKQEKLLGGIDKKEFHCFCVSDDAFSFLSWQLMYGGAH